MHESISENQRQWKPVCVCVCVWGGGGGGGGKLDCIVTPNTMIVIADFVHLVRNKFFKFKTANSALHKAN